MTIFYDVTSLLAKNLSAEGIYTKNLFRLLKGLGADIHPIYKPQRGFKENSIEFHIHQSAKKFFGFFAAKGTILHGPSVDLPSESDKFKKVISINDMAMFRDGFMDQGLAKQLQTHMKEQLQKNPAAVLLPNYEVHNEFLVRFPKYLNKVHIIPPGCDHILDSSNVSDKRISESPYFLFMGPIEKRTNVVGVLKAFNGFCQIQKKINLVLCGENGYGSEAVHQMIHSLPCRDRIQYVGYKSGAQLKKIYADAIATVVPSLYEGFPYSVVESMKMGCPVVTSARGSMADVGREAAHLVNPNDPEQIMAGMERLLVDNAYRAKLISAGQALTEKMTWLKCAQDVAQIYSKI